jgi:hypothetical protein
MCESCERIWVVTLVIDLKAAVYNRPCDEAKPRKCEEV